MLARMATTVALFALPLVGGADARDVRLQMHALDERTAAAPILDRLVDGDVLRLKIERGPENSRGLVQQCIRTAVSFDECANLYPVQFDDTGTAEFQYQLRDRGRCGAGQACVVLIDDLDGKVAYAFTVFGEPAPAPPTLVLSPPGPYLPGDSVQVEMSGLIPDVDVSVAYCATDCGASLSARADTVGRAVVPMVIGGRGGGLSITTGSTELLIEVEFLAAPRPDYSALRLGLGLSAAGALLLAAWWIIATVDWRPPSEAATPEFDLVDEHQSL